MPYLVGYVTPQDYGAAGNGTTDDTTAFQNALNAINTAGGGTLFVPAGTYKLSAALSGYSNVSMIGVNPAVSVLNQTSTTVNGVTYNTTSGNLNYISISGLTIQGPGSGSGVGLLVEAASGASQVTSAALSELVITGFGSHGLELVTGSGCSLNNVNVTSVGGHCYYLNGGTSNSLTACYAGGNTSTQIGYLLSAASYCTLTGCKVFGTGAGYQISGGSCCAVVSCGADTISAQAGQNGDGFEVNGGTGHNLINCFSNINKAVAFYVTGSAAAVSMVGVQEVNPSAATNSIKVDVGSTATVVNNTVVTTTSLAAGTTGVLNNVSFLSTGTVDISVAGHGLQVAEGTNAKQGTATLTAGTVTVSNASVTATSRIFLTTQTPGGTVGSPYVSARTAGTSFTITSTSATDTSTVAYEIFEVG